MKNAAATAINLVTLLVGIAIGFLLAHYPPGGVFAQTPPQVEEVFVGATFPAAAFGTVLAGRIATDEIAVRGVDLVKPAREHPKSSREQAPMVHARRRPVRHR